MPLAHLPRGSFGDWIAFLRGRKRMEGVPIAKEELPVGSLLRPVLERLSPPEFQLAIHDLLTWWGNRAEESSPRRPFRVRHIEATSCLLETCPPLADLFELSRDNLEFRTEVPASVRQETSEYIHRHYKPYTRR